MYCVVQKLKMVKTMLKDFNKLFIGDIFAAQFGALQELQQCQEDLQKDPFNFLLMEKEKEARLRHRQTSRNYCSMLAQKAKIDWIIEGDDNTTIFHRSLKMKRNQNMVYAIKKADGEWVDEDNSVTQAFINFYSKLLGSRMTARIEVNMKVVLVGQVVTEVQKQFLMKPYIEEEVKQALFSTPNTKAPGHDDFNSFFFKKSCNIVGKEVAEAILSFLHSREILREINATTLTLVPKLKCPKSVADFRPIACCNVLYKISTKMICLRF
ncbi:uncharacterized protein LOC133791550 [Humulus lupulus]|uniref:uncharacterized protein LOC133791550 n=1 Tax=Humulus lupulus TaxID=3486 RepID=UPI002B410CE1|nr:uncharacterized protein LOC133791550 [Humulus lupulus]